MIANTNMKCEECGSVVCVTVFDSFDRKYKEVLHEDGCSRKKSFFCRGRKLYRYKED